MPLANSRSLQIQMLYHHRSLPNRLLQSGGYPSKSTTTSVRVLTCHPFPSHRTKFLCSLLFTAHNQKAFIALIIFFLPTARA
eukprot:scaffold5011_cov143-Skeletonema_menzelii.AAC.15